jgi:L-erythro-3,5-diaminohexanoate dehydrogenase
VSGAIRLRTDSDAELSPQAIGSFRSLRPRGVLPHAAEVLDSRTPPNDFELALDVQMLAVDATSYRTIREHCDGDAERMAEKIAEIVAARGKLQNPWTGSGGVLVGRVTHVGERYDRSPVREGDVVVPLVSLISLPLLLDSVGPLRPDSSHVLASGRAIVTGRMAVAHLPEDLASGVAIAALDVYPAASHARGLARGGDHVLVLGAGHAGLLAMVAAREATSAAGHVTAVDVSAEALARAAIIDPAVTALEADVTDPLAVAGAIAAAGLPRADLTLVCTTVPGAEGTALLATSDHGKILFFSTATSFAAAALGADSIGSRAQLIIPNGLTEDAGGYAFELLRGNLALLSAFQEGL